MKVAYHFSGGLTILEATRPGRSIIVYVRYLVTVYRPKDYQLYRPWQDGCVYQCLTQQ
jgi:hypothetical protein